MIKRICDCCGAEIKKDFVNFCIAWDMVNAVSGNCDKGKPIMTPYLEYCVTCFNGFIGELGLEKDRNSKE